MWTIIRGSGAFDHSVNGRNFQEAYGTAPFRDRCETALYNVVRGLEIRLVLPPN